jgi:hypothetical protein
MQTANKSRIVCGNLWLIKKFESLGMVMDGTLGPSMVASRFSPRQQAI